MSERGSFVTEYIYCSECLRRVQRGMLALRPSKYFTAYQIPSWEGNGFLPIIAGKLGGLYAGEEVHTMESIIEGEIDNLCHDVRIVVIPDTGPPQTLVARKQA